MLVSAKSVRTTNNIYHGVFFVVRYVRGALRILAFLEGLSIEKSDYQWKIAFTFIQNLGEISYDKPG